MARYESWFKQDLKKPISVQMIQGNLFSADVQGNLIGVEVFDDGEAATLAGTVSANIIRPDGGTVAASGTFSGNKCSVVLPAAAYAYPGVATIAIKITDSGVVTTLLAAVVTIYRTSTDTVVDPGTIMPSIQSLITQIQTAVASIPADYSSLWTTLAPAYTSLTFPVKAGQYCTNGGVFYRAKQDIATSEEFTSSHWDVANIGNELSSLKSALEHISDNGIIAYTDPSQKKYLNTSGSTVDFNNPATAQDDNFKYAVVPCSPGDKFTINGTGGQGGRLWAFADSLYNILSPKAEASASATELVITAPATAAYLIINDKANKQSYTGELLCDRVDNLNNAIDNLNNASNDLKNGLALLSQGLKDIDIYAKQRAKTGSTLPNFAKGYSVNTTSGVIGTTTNERYFAINNTGVYTHNIRVYTKLYIKLDPTYTSRIYYAFFSDNTGTLVGSVTRVDIENETIVELSVPEGALYLNAGGYSKGNAYNDNAAATTFLFGRTSFFDGLLDTELTSTTLPAQGKAVGDKITSLETLRNTTGLSKLRITPNSNNINFAVKTGLTNLFLGYGSGGNNDEDTTGESSQEYDNGKYNTAVGVEAFRNNETGDHCTAVGFTALKYNYSGDFNTCIGEDALYSNTSGGNNIAVGDHAGQNNNGSNNILIGARVMRPATNASGNIIIGKEAGSVLDTGGNNIIIGNGRNPSSDSSNNLLIGDSSHSTVVIAGKTISFNQDGTVTWS